MIYEPFFLRQIIDLSSKVRLSYQSGRNRRTYTLVLYVLSIALLCGVAQVRLNQPKIYALLQGCVAYTRLA